MAIPSIRDEYLAKYRGDRFKAGFALTLAFAADDPETMKMGYESEPALIAADRVFDFDVVEFQEIGLAMGIDEKKLKTYLANRAAKV